MERDWKRSAIECPFWEGIPCSLRQQRENFLDFWHFRLLDTVKMESEGSANAKKSRFAREIRFFMGFDVRIPRK